MLKDVEVIEYKKLKELLIDNEVYAQLCLLHKAYLSVGIPNNYQLVDMFAEEAHVESYNRMVYFSENSIHVEPIDADGKGREFPEKDSVFLKFTIKETGTHGITLINFKADSDNPFHDHDVMHLSIDK